MRALRGFCADPAWLGAQGHRSLRRRGRCAGRARRQTRGQDGHARHGECNRGLRHLGWCRCLDRRAGARVKACPGSAERRSRGGRRAIKRHRTIGLRGGCGTRDEPPGVRADDRASPGSGIPAGRRCHADFRFAHAHLRSCAGLRPRRGHLGAWRPGEAVRQRNGPRSGRCRRAGIRRRGIREALSRRAPVSGPARD